MSKYRAKPCQVGAEKYRSGRERDRHQQLLMMQSAGRIVGLVREVVFVLAPGIRIEGEKRARPALRYYADFVFSDVQTGKVVVEDSKGMRTPVYRVKKHLMASIHNIHIVET